VPQNFGVYFSPLETPLPLVTRWGLRDAEAQIVPSNPTIEGGRDEVEDPE